MYTKNKNKMIHFRLSDNDYNDLYELSKHYKLSVSQFSRQILTMYLAERRIVHNANNETDFNN